MDKFELEIQVESVKVGKVIEVTGNPLFDATFIRLDKSTWSWIKFDTLRDESMKESYTYAKFSTKDIVKKINYATDAGCSVRYPLYMYDVNELLNQFNQET